MKTMFIVLCVAIVGLVIFGAVENKINADAAVAAAAATSNESGSSSEESGTSSSKVKIILSGEVNKTGTYSIVKGATLSDAIEAAGGSTSNADSRCYDKNLEISSNMSIYIAPISKNNDVCSREEIKKININKSTSEEITNATSLTSTLATSLVSYRDSNGDFTYLEQIMNVSGIKEGYFTKVKDYITLFD